MDLSCFVVLCRPILSTWWRHQMETFSALLALYAGNSPIHGEFPAQRPVMRSFDVFLDLRLNKRLSKQSWGWWFEKVSCPWRRHSNAMVQYLFTATRYWIIQICYSWYLTSYHYNIFCNSLFMSITVLFGNITASDKQCIQTYSTRVSNAYKHIQHAW